MLIFKEQVVLHSGCAWNCNHFWTFDKETTTSELTAVLHQHGSGIFFFFFVDVVSAPVTQKLRIDAVTTRESINE